MKSVSGGVKNNNQANIRKAGAPAGQKTPRKVNMNKGTGRVKASKTY